MAPGTAERGGNGVRVAAATVVVSAAAAPKQVYGRLSKHSPYIGFFHYAPSAGNRSRRTYFEKDIMSIEDVERQHEVRSNAMIGIFHYGHDLYGERYINFQRILAKLRAKDVEREVEREVEAVLERNSRPFGGGMKNPSTGGAQISSAAVARLHRGRARSISNSTVDQHDGGGKYISRCFSVSKAAILEEAVKAVKAESAAIAAGRARLGVDRETTRTTPMLHRASTTGSNVPVIITTSCGNSCPVAAQGLTLSGPAAGGRGAGALDGANESDTDSRPAPLSRGGVSFYDGSSSSRSSRSSSRSNSSSSNTNTNTHTNDGGDDNRGREPEGGVSDDGVGSQEEAVRRKLQDYQDKERRRLRSNAFAVVVYGSGDSLVKMAEKERRNGGATKRFKYAGAIDTSKAYPKSGTLDDCALLRPVVAERSKLYNDLIAETNGFRRHFFFRQKMHPKEAYRQARRKQEVEASMDFDVEDLNGRGRMKSDSWLFNNPSLRGINGSSYSSGASDPVAPGSSVSGPLGGGGGGISANGSGGGNGGGAPGDFYAAGVGGGGAGPGTGGGGGGFYDSPARMGGGGVAGIDDGVPPFHTLVGPGQFLRHTSVEAEQPGGTWMPGTVSAQRAKESWRGKQEMRDFRKFKPFFVQAKTDFTATYRLLNDCLLGEGSYASVYLAQHIKRGELVAVKAVQKRLLFSDSEKKSVRAEIDNQLRIVHKHVVRLYEVYETPDNVFIVLENCPCGDLEKMMYLRGRLTEIEAKRVTMQLLEGLDYLHSKGIVHCDIKPQNLLFANDPDSPDAAADAAAEEAAEAAAAAKAASVVGGSGGAVAAVAGGALDKKQVASPAGRLAKLCDFGISCKVPDVRFYKQTGDINKIPWSGLFGTGGYIAPEIMQQKPFGKPADLWSVGVMLYQMISGRLPFIPARVCVSKAVAFPATVWGSVSVAAKDFICGLLEKDPAHRLTATQALQHPWIKTIHHLRPSFPHFVPVASRSNSTPASGSVTAGGGGL